MLERLFKGDGVCPNLSLIHKRLFRWMQIFNWVFYCYNVVFPLFVYLAYHGCKCRGLTAACWACYKHKASWLSCKLLYYGWKTKLLKCQYLKRNGSENTCNCAPLNKIG